MGIRGMRLLSRELPEEVAREKDGAAPIKAHPAPKIPFPVLGRVVLVGLRQWKLRRFMIQGLHLPGMMILQGVKLKKGRDSREGKDVRKSRMVPVQREGS